MSFSGNTIYSVTYTDWFDQSCEIRIKENGYAGSSTAVVCGRDPIEISWETPSDFILEPINGSMGTIYLMAETTMQFLNLYTADGRKYKVEKLIEGTIVWSSFILPDQYQEEYKYPPYANAFLASDQLGYLKTILWDKTNNKLGTQYGDYSVMGVGYYTPTLMEALGWIFEKTGMELNLREGINVYETGHNSTAADSPLDQTYFHGVAYDGMTYYDVLRDILLKFGAVLRQRNNEWFIFRPIEARAAFTTRLWTYSSGVFTYSSNTSTNLIQSTTTAPPDTDKADLIKIAGGRIFIRPGWKKYTLNLLKKIDNTYQDGSLSVWEGGKPKYWTLSTGMSYSQQGKKIRIDSISSSASRRFTQTLITYIVNWLATFRFNVYVPAGETMQMGYSFGSNGYSRTWDNSAGTTPLQTSETFLETLQSTFHAGPPPFRNFDFGCLQPYGCTGGYVEISFIGAQPLQGSGTDAPAFEDIPDQEVEINSNNNYDYGNLELITADLDDEIEGFRDVYRGALFKAFAFYYWPIDQTLEWTSPEITGTLVDILKLQISQLCQNPQQVISAPVYSKLLDSCSVLQDIDNSDRYFLIRRATWNPKYGIWDVEAHQIGIAPELPLVDEDGNALVDEFGNALYG